MLTTKLALCGMGSDADDRRCDRPAAQCDGMHHQTADGYAWMTCPDGCCSTEPRKMVAAPAASASTADAADALLDLFYSGPIDRIGVYEKDGRVFVVKPNRAKTNIYAMEMIADANGVRLEYAPGAKYQLHPCHKVSRAWGEELSAKIGACCVCGRTLTNKKSVAAGIGPVCGASFAF